LARPPIPEELLSRGFRKAVLDFLVAERAITEDLRSRLLGWRLGGGFSVHNRVRVAAEDAEGPMKLAGYMLRTPLSPCQDELRRGERHGVIDRSKMHPGAEAELPGDAGRRVDGVCSASTFRIATSTWCAMWGGVLQPCARRAGEEGTCAAARVRTGPLEHTQIE